MIKFLCLLVVILSQMPLTGLFSHEENHRELTILTPLEAIYGDQENLFIDIQGVPHAVKSLTKVGSSWSALVDDSYVDAARFCPQGHPNCENCGMCHTPKCWRSVPYCNKWK